MSSREPSQLLGLFSEVQLMSSSCVDEKCATFSPSEYGFGSTGALAWKVFSHTTMTMTTTWGLRPWTAPVAQLGCKFDLILTATVHTKSTQSLFEDVSVFMVYGFNLDIS